MVIMAIVRVCIEGGDFSCSALVDRASMNDGRHTHLVQGCCVCCFGYVCAGAREFSSESYVSDHVSAPAFSCADSARFGTRLLGILSPLRFAHGQVYAHNVGMHHAGKCVGLARYLTVFMRINASLCLQCPIALHGRSPCISDRGWNRPPSNFDVVPARLALERCLIAITSTATAVHFSSLCA
jgi:hypothetical protein